MAAVTTYYLEKISENTLSKCDFLMRAGLKSSGFLLGKNARDLGGQSAERWSLGEDAGLHNFELHSFRAAFQIPEFLATVFEGSVKNKRVLMEHIHESKDENVREKTLSEKARRTKNKASREKKHGW